MINALKKSGMIIVLLLLSISTFAQENQPVEMAESLTQSGKIYVVVTVLSVIFIGIIVYLISIDRKISKLEKEVRK